jgi:hypothetical protein
LAVSCELVEQSNRSDPRFLAFDKLGLNGCHHGCRQHSSGPGDPPGRAKTAGSALSGRCRWMVPDR